ncbi:MULTISPECIES: AAA domain-containing protein [unclassified Micromonospora]|uniref:AAA domain-containing protein n=1 Tax=unclassified Micromonospora TaxID=2617518 RepID=UPI002FF13C7B
MTGEIVDQIVDRYFGRNGRGHGPYVPPGGASLSSVRTDIIPGTLYRYELVDGDGRALILQIYLNIAALGGLMWEQEIRVLLRANGLRHPALPEIVDGGYEDDGEATRNGFAFVVTRGGLNTLASVAGSTGFLHARPAEALRHFSMLANALAILHDHGLIHRNLWTGSITVESANEETDELVLRLSRFEMSTLVANLLRAATLDASSTSDQVRELLLDQSDGSRALLYASPERIDFLFPPADRGGFLDDQRSDVYSLGVVVWEWFFGPLSVEVPAQLGDPGEVQAWARAARERMRTRLREERTIPRALCDLLLLMLGERPGDRPESSTVVARLAEHYAVLANHFTARVSDRPFLVAYMPKESIPTIYEWGWIRSSPMTPEGRAELAAFLEHDLRAAILVHAPHGADPYIDAGTHAGKREARQLLVGERAAWFCQPFRPTNALGVASATPIDEVLLIKYVVPLESQRARRIQAQLDRSRFRQRPTPIQAIAYDIHPRELEAQRAGRPSWRPLIESVRSPVERTPDEMVYEQAIEWLLEYQGVELRAREYAYSRVETSGGGQIKLVFDDMRDLARQHNQPMLAKYASSTRRRPPFARFFESMAFQDGNALIEAVADDRGLPSDRLFSGKVRFVRYDNDTTLVVQATGGTGRLPEHGWLRPADDFGTRIALRRQIAARWELLDNRTLLDQLRNPVTIRGMPTRWQQAIHAFDNGDPKPRPLSGSSAETVLEMLVSQPFYAVQGPPGTGKTEIASRAVAAYLTADHGSRVLISAQANFALDNLAERLLRYLGALDEQGRMVVKQDLLPVRIVSPSADTVDTTPMGQFKLSQLTPQRRKMIADAVKQDLSRDDGWTEVREQYLAVLPAALPELDDRFLRGANLVFATCLAATRGALATTDSSLFDWVVVEEAAKAWPGELAIPLSQGLRWTLLGDHKQLPAHRREDVLSFLGECALDPNPDLNVHGRRQAEYERVFSLFGSLFAEDLPAARGPLNRPLRTLDSQFRMRPAIGELVSRVFYPVSDGPEWTGGSLPPGRVSSPAEGVPHGFETPGSIRGRDLVWLDTAKVSACQDLPAWSNEGEARIVADFVRRLRPTPPHGGLTVLTPYREQKEVLARLGLPVEQLSTVPAFQGREADVVVLSLVRDRRRGDSPISNIGYLIQPELVNVMMSRARKLLVIVGNFDHFAGVGDFWARVCAGVEQFGVRLDAAEVTGE